MRKTVNILFAFILCIAFPTIGFAQNAPIPSSHSNIAYDEEGRLYFTQDGQRYYADTTKANYTIEKLLGSPKGTKEGLQLDFGNLEGSITYGLIPYGQAPHPLPVFRFTKIKSYAGLYNDFSLYRV